MLPRIARPVVCFGVMMLAAADLPCQTFDLATVRPNHNGAGRGDLTASPGMLTIRNLALRAIIGSAYGLADYQISGPKWLGQERFDIVAKTDASITGEDEMLPLLQPLLADRFHLTVHRETKQLPAFVLTVGPNGPKLEAADAGGAAPPSKKAKKSSGSRIHAEHLTMPQFAEILSRRLGRPVLDMTKLAGAYRVNLEWAAENETAKPDKPAKAVSGTAKADTDRPSIFTALQEQMGLRLQARKAPVQVVVIDHIEKTPTEN
jgi:uncharacterized protein (TIGR03435 family)